MGTKNDYSLFLKESFWKRYQEGGWYKTSYNVAVLTTFFFQFQVFGNFFNTIQGTNDFPQIYIKLLQLGHNMHISVYRISSFNNNL